MSKIILEKQIITKDDNTIIVCVAYSDVKKVYFEMISDDGGFVDTFLTKSEVEKLIEVLKESVKDV